MAELEFRGELRPAVNVLDDRYASPEMRALFSDDGKVFAERGLWIAVMEAQADLGLPIPREAIADYEQVQAEIDHNSMAERERISGHDVNARIEEFNALAGHQYIHTGMTSRDLTENVEQWQIRQGLGIIHDRTVATLTRFAARAVEHEELVMAGRSHNVAAQPITLGKRLANYGEELLLARDRVKRLTETVQLRGIKGPVGTQQDMLDLFEGDQTKVDMLESRIANKLGFRRTMNSVGQVYPRSLDFDVITALQQTAAGPSSFAKTVRLMAGQELVTEGFAPGRVGSSAMPHKMNASRSERVTGLYSVLSGYTTMAGHLAGDQWNEGDVSCSATRRVAIPDAFRAADGVQLTTMSVLDGFGAYPEVVHAELERYLPFLATSKALMAAVRAGAGREDAHKVIKKHATAVALEMREQGTRENDLFDRLHNDPEIPVSRDQLDDAIGNPIGMTGSAATQVLRFAQHVEMLAGEYPEAAAYVPPKVR